MIRAEKILSSWRWFGVNANKLLASTCSFLRFFLCAQNGDDDKLDSLKLRWGAANAITVTMATGKMQIFLTS